MPGRDNWIEANVPAWLLALLGAAGAVVADNLTATVTMLLVMMAIDVASGVASACAEGVLDSRVSYRGLMRKALALLVVAAARVLEPALGGVPVADVVAGSFVLTEAMSVLENARRGGVPVPEFLTNMIRNRAKAPDGGGARGRDEQR